MTSQVDATTEATSDHRALAEATRGLFELYAELDRVIAAENPRCDASGRCCRFTEYGHMLFLSRLEATALAAIAPPVGQPIGPDGCPYQIGGLCTARERRPIGCRVYFCDPAFADRQIELSEDSIGKLKRLHESVGLPWRYGPLHQILAEVLALGPPTRYNNSGLQILELA